MATPLYNNKPMTIADINQVLTEYRFRREKVQQELDTIDKMMVYWKKQRETLRDEIERTSLDGRKPNLFEQMFGETVDVPEIRMKPTDFLP